MEVKQKCGQPIYVCVCVCVRVSLELVVSGTSSSYSLL